MNGVNYLSAAFSPIVTSLNGTKPQRPNNAILRSFSDALKREITSSPTRLHKNWFKLCNELDTAAAQITPEIVKRANKIAVMVAKRVHESPPAPVDPIVKLVNDELVKEKLDLVSTGSEAFDSEGFKAAFDLVQRIMRGLYGEHLKEKLSDLVSSPLLLNTTLVRLVLLDKLANGNLSLSHIEWFRDIPINDVFDLRVALTTYFQIMEIRYSLPRQVCLSRLLSGSTVSDANLEAKICKIVNAAKYTRETHTPAFKRLMPYTGVLTDAQIGLLTEYMFKRDPEVAFQVACRASDGVRVELVSALLKDLLDIKKVHLACDLINSLIGEKQELYSACVGKFILELARVNQMNLAFEFAFNTDRQGTQYFDVAMPLIRFLAARSLTGQDGRDIQSLIEAMPYLEQRSEAIESCFSTFLLASARENDFERNFATCQQFLSKFKGDDLKRLGLGSLHFIPLYTSLICTSYKGSEAEFQKRVETFEKHADPTLRQSLLERVTAKLLQDQEATDEDLKRVEKLATTLKAQEAKTYLYKTLALTATASKPHLAQDFLKKIPDTVARIETERRIKEIAPRPVATPIEPKAAPTIGIGRMFSSIFSAFARKSY